MLTGSLCAMAGHDNLKSAISDSVARRSAWTEALNGKAAHSAYPVSLTVKGNSLCVSSKHKQELPIYTQGGALYLTMQLATGKNWLYGLPRGRYRINNRIVSIL
ncbi:MAG: hypothetical protein LUC33_03820 [Prevotellaceae bacterium]|nr:hypothetical protein [Prevotellaceae bacterium]